MFFVIAHRGQNAILLLQANLPRHQHVQLSLRTLHFHPAVRGVDLHARGHWNRSATNTCHLSYPLLSNSFTRLLVFATKLRKVSRRPHSLSVRLFHSSAPSA